MSTILRSYSSGTKLVADRETSQVGGVRFSRLPKNAKFLAVCGVTATFFAVSLAFYQTYLKWVPARTFTVTGTGLFDTSVHLNRLFCEAWPPHDASALRGAHLLFLALCGLAAIVCFADVGIWRPGWVSACGGIGGLSLASGIIGLCVTTEATWKPAGVTIFAGLVGCLLMIVFGKGCSRRAVNRFFAVICLGAASAAVGLPFYQTFDLSSAGWETVEIHMAHWLYLISHADRLFHDAEMFRSANPFYGQWTTMLSVVLQRLFGEFDIGDYVTFILALQCVAIALTTYVYSWLAKGRWLLCCLPLACVIANSASAFTPANHTAWRHLGFPVIMTLWIGLRNQELRLTAFILGCFSIGAIIQNSETGIALSGGCLAYQIARGRSSSIRSISAQIAAWSGGMFCGLCSWMLMCRAAYGHWPDLSAALVQLQFLRLVSATGFGGFRLDRVDPWAFVIFLHAAFVWLFCIFDHDRRTTGRLAFRAAISTTILLWFAYYANRPHAEYLHSFLMFYGCLLIDLLRVLVAGRRSSVPRLAVAASLMIVGVFVFPAAYDYGHQRYLLERYIHRDVLASTKERTAVSGMALAAGPRAEAILQKANYLREHAGRQPVFFTIDSYLIPKAAGVWSPLPAADVFWECVSAAQFEFFIREFQRLAPAEVLFDDEESIPLDAGTSPASVSFRHREFLRQFRDEYCTDYEYVRTEDHWMIWRRKTIP